MDKPTAPALDERKEFLVRTPFFGGLEEEALDAVIQMLRECEYPTGSTVFREGEQGRSMYIVHSGELMKSQSGESGRSVRLMRFQPGDFFGETTLIEMQPRQFTVTAERTACLYELTNMDLYRLYKLDMHAYVMVLQNINRELCRRLRRSDERITEMADEFGDPRTQIGMANRIRRLPEDR
jgi:CRP-like cAMP-binding protein